MVEKLEMVAYTVPPWYREKAEKEVLYICIQVYNLYHSLWSVKKNNSGRRFNL